MKTLPKKIALAIMFIGLFFIPGINSAQTIGSTVNEGEVAGTDNINIENPIQDEDKSTAEEEAEEELSSYALYTVLRNGGQAIKTTADMVSDISLYLQYSNTFIPRK